MLHNIAVNGASGYGIIDLNTIAKVFINQFITFGLEKGAYTFGKLFLIRSGIKSKSNRFICTVSRIP